METFLRQDVGSTTVKATVTMLRPTVVCRTTTHDTKQPERSRVLQTFDTKSKVSRPNSRMFMTGSGGNGLASTSAEIRPGITPFARRREDDPECVP